MPYSQAYIYYDVKCEVLSEGGGQHWTVIDSACSAVTSGDLVIVNQLIGVALTDYDAATQSFVLDCTGGHKLHVHAENSLGNVVVQPGDWLFYDIAAGYLNKDSTSSYCVGQALEFMYAGASADIGVKLQPNPWYAMKVGL